MRPRPLALSFALAFVLTCGATAEPALETDDAKTIYALGLVLARNADQFALSPEEVEVLVSGFSDAVHDRTPRVELETWGPKIDGLAQARREKSAAAETEASRSFVDEAAGQPGAVRTQSGLVYQETQAGGGARPKATDTVKVHYEGRLRDGSVFDSSRQRGTPAQFPLNRVIPCWTEGLQLMSVGGKATLVCPAEIAYGSRGAGGKIPPGAALRFEVELLEIVEAAAATPQPTPPPAKPGS
jgi:FKBP-type peptidyl-prolyl cis-trans isomerase FkpA